MVSDYYCVSASPMKDSKQSLRGRPYGGTAILITNKFKQSMIETDTSDTRLIYVKLKSKFGELLLVNICLLCNTNENKKSHIQLSCQNL